MTDPRPLLVSFHRDLADHQRIAAARALCGADATLDSIEYEFRYRPFDEANPEVTAHELVNDLAAAYPDWLGRRLVYVPPGLHDAASALGVEMRKRVKDGLNARPLKLFPRRARRKGEDKDVSVDPVVFVAGSLEQSLDGSQLATPIAPDLYADHLPRSVVLLDMAAPCADSDERARDQLWDDLWRSSDMADFYPDRFRPIHAGTPTFPEMEDNADAWIEAFKSRLDKVAHDNELVWSSEPLVFSWLGASGNQMAAALAVLHGLSGGFPNCVLYAPKGRQPADCYANCNAEIVSARIFRQKYHPAPTQQTKQMERADEPADEVGPQEIPPTALAWLINYWARDLNHARDNGRRCDPLLQASLTPDGKTIADVLPRETAHVHVMHCRDADRAHGQGEWDPLMWANQVFAYRVGRYLYRTSPQCRPVAEALQALAAAKSQSGSSVRVEARCDAQDQVALSLAHLSDALGDMVTTTARLRGDTVVLTYHDLRLGLAHNGTLPDIPTVKCIRDGNTGQGTGKLLECATVHGATLRLLWQTPEGLYWTGKDGGEWVFAKRPGYPLTQTREAEASWWEISGYGGRVPRAGWALPDGMTTLWEFELPGLLRCCVPRVPDIIA